MKRTLRSNLFTPLMAGLLLTLAACQPLATSPAGESAGDTPATLVVGSHDSFAISEEIITAFEAGQRMARLARQADFTLFDHWLTDYVGHRCEMGRAVEVLEQLDDSMVARVGIAICFRNGTIPKA